MQMSYNNVSVTWSCKLQIKRKDKVRYPVAAFGCVKLSWRDRCSRLLLLLLFCEDAAKRRKTSQSSIQLSLHFISPFTYQPATQIKLQTEPYTHFCLSKTHLRPWYRSPSSFSLQHAADNELVLPTHCIYPQHLHCNRPFLLWGGLCLSLKPPAESSAWKVCVGGREVRKKEIIQINHLLLVHNNEPCVKHSQAN